MNPYVDFHTFAAADETIAGGGDYDDCHHCLYYCDYY